MIDCPMLVYLFVRESRSGVKIGMNMFGLYFLDTPVIGE